MGRKSRDKAARRGSMRPPGADEIVARLRMHELSVRDSYPDAWLMLDEARAMRDSLAWPSWCWVPLAASVAVVRGAAGPPDALISSPVAPADAPAIAVVGALGAWRQSRTVYRIDPDMYRALTETPLDDAIPGNALRRLPEWGVYIALPDGTPLGNGFFAHLEWDVQVQRPELRILTDRGGILTPLILYLDRGSFAQAIRDHFAVSAAHLQAARNGEEVDGIDIHDATGDEWTTTAGLELGADIADRVVDTVRQHLTTAVNVLLYLCAEEPDILDPDQPPEHATHTVTRAPRPPATLRVWEVGMRVGAALRAARDRGDTPGTGTHAGPRPHVRRAHWHRYWTGPRDGERTIRLRWLSPIPVNVNDPDELPVTFKS